MARISIDCDGVLANFNRAFSQLLNSIKPGSFHPETEPTTWDWIVDKKLETAAWSKLKRTENWWTTLDAYPGNVSDLQQFFIAHQHHDVYITTARALSAGMTISQQTQHWLDSCYIQTHNNYMAVITGVGAADKAKLYDLMGIEYSIDDKAETVQSCDQLPNHKAYLLDRPWNRHIETKRRVMSVGEMLKDVTNA